MGWVGCSLDKGSLRELQALFEETHRDELPPRHGVHGEVPQRPEHGVQQLQLPLARVVVALLNLRRLRSFAFEVYL